MINTIAQRVHEAIVSGGTAIVGISIGDPANKATWLVSPANLQNAAQPTIDAFDVSQDAQDLWDEEQRGKIVGVTRAKRKTADQAFSTNGLADVTDLQILLSPNTHYEFHAYGAYTSASATTGIQLSVNGPAAPTLVRFTGEIAESVTARRCGAGANYDVVIAGTASAAATALPWELKGSISTGAVGGLFSVRARSEINGSAVTVLRGSILKVSAVA